MARVRLRELIYRRAGGPRHEVAVGGLFALWLVVVLLGALHHVVWRDEVRALSIALQGDDIPAMVHGLHGEGHPAVWYLLLRGAYALFGIPQVLQGVAFGVAAVTMLALVAWSPFALPVLALLFFGRGAIYEYSVMARNYGISILLLFVLAAAYERYRRRGIVIGIVLAILANCNAHSDVIVFAFLIFWYLDVFYRGGEQPTADIKVFLMNAGIAGVGCAVAGWTLYSPLVDAVVIHQPEGFLATRISLAMFLPIVSYEHLVGGPPIALLSEQHTPFNEVVLLVRYVLLSLLLIGCTLGLARRPAALVGCLTALFGLSLFFQLVYPGSYRHEALWLAFLVAMYWIAARDGQTGGSTIQPTRARFVTTATKIGYVSFVILLVIQIPSGFRDVINIVGGEYQESQSMNFSMMLSKHKELRGAVILADPDYVLDSLPYYISNKLYFIRDRRYAKYAIYARGSSSRIGLGDILAQARAIQAAMRRPVIVLLQQKLDPAAPARVVSEGLNGELSLTPEDIRAFQTSTRLLGRSVATLTDENFDVYILNDI